MATTEGVEPAVHDQIDASKAGFFRATVNWLLGVKDMQGTLVGEKYERLYSKENLANLNVETLKLAMNDAQRSLDGHLTVLTELSGKAVQLLQINGLVLTLLIAVAIDLDAAGEYVYWVTGVGLLCFILSFVLAFLAYLNRPAKIGISDEDLRYLLTTGEEFDDEKIYPIWRLDTLADNIEYARLSFQPRLRAVRASMALFVIGIVVLSVGVLLRYAGVLG